MSKKKKENGINFGSIEKNATFWASMVLLAIMVLSIGGFALSSGGGTSSSSNTQPSEIPFGQIFQNPQTEELYWGAVKNNEQFIFETIDGFDNRTDLANLAGAIKVHENIEIYVDPSFNSAESEYILDKTFRGLQIPTQKLLNKSCTKDTLVLTTNNTLEGDCMIFESSVGKEYRDMENLMYFLVQ